MSDSTPRLALEGGSEIAPELVDQAIAWSVRLRLHVASAAELQAFRAWREADARHEAAWQRIEAMQGDLAALPRQTAREVLAASERSAASRRARRTTVKLILAGAAVGGGVYACRDSAWMQAATADHSTGTGERRTVQLDDGTQLVLNAGSAVNIHFDANRRLIEVERGEIQVSTGADARSPQHRPFLVITTHGTMQALGTRFVVRRQAEQTRLTVQQHAVQMRSAQSGAAMLARAGDSYYMSRTAIWAAPQTGFDPLAWTEGLIAAREMRLEDFLAELSRYRPGILRCDAAIAGLPISGVFQLPDTDRILDVLQATQPVATRYRTRWWVTMVPRAV